MEKIVEEPTVWSKTSACMLCSNNISDFKATSLFTVLHIDEKWEKTVNKTMYATNR